MTTRLPSITDPPDSLFTWVFHAEGGDSWGGWLVDNTGRYAVGASLAAARGTYVIVAAEDQAQDLSLHGLEEGQVFVAWYRDAGLGQFLPTRNGGATPSGTGGLGTEQDAAWNGEGWDAFGLGGADLADAVERPDSLFAWVFASDAGDTLWGTLHADSADHAPGDTVRGAAGTYRILEETPYGRDTGLAEGTVTTTRYLDGASRLHLALESAGLVATGLAGLGSEFDRAAGAVQAGTAGGGPAAAQVGLAGLRQADRQPDVRFTYRFQADEGGDSWTGWLIGHAPALQPGAVIVTAHGPLHHHRRGSLVRAGHARRLGLDHILPRRADGPRARDTGLGRAGGARRHPRPRLGAGPGLGWRWLGSRGARRPSAGAGRAGNGLRARAGHRSPRRVGPPPRHGGTLAGC
jgi:hypothetical protein